MQPAIWALLCLVSAASHLIDAAPPKPPKQDAGWIKYKRSFGKVYNASGEDSLRYECWTNWMKEIKEHNKKGSWRAGPTWFTDWSKDELKGLFHDIKTTGPIESDPVCKEGRMLVANSWLCSRGGSGDGGGDGATGYEKWRKDWFMSPMEKGKGKGVKDPDGWIRYKKAFKKVYTDPKEDAYRHARYRKELKDIEKNIRRGSPIFYMGLTKFTDWSDSEWAAIRPVLGADRPPPPFKAKQAATSEDAWQEYKKTFRKVYKDPKVDRMRHQRFLKTLAKIAEHNGRPNVGQKWALNELSDWSDNEIGNLFHDMRIPSSDEVCKGGRVLRAGEWVCDAAGGTSRAGPHNPTPPSPPPNSKNRASRGSNDGWEKFKKKYDKLYEDPKEDAYRRKLYLAAKERVVDHNRAPHRWLAGLDEFSDWHDAEWGAIHPPIIQIM